MDFIQEEGTVHRWVGITVETHRENVRYQITESAPKSLTYKLLLIISLDAILSLAQLLTYLYRHNDSISAVHYTVEAKA